MKASFAFAILLVALGGASTPLPGADAARRALSSFDADSCENKLNRIKAFAPVKKAGASQTVYFTEDELNAWLALRFKLRAHPCLKDLAVELEDGQALVTAAIDFNRLREDADGVLPKIIAFMFSGVHTISAHGKVVSGDGKGMFDVDRARFDNVVIPGYLMNEILSAVGLRQSPPVDPSKLSPLPFGLDRMDVRKGSLLAYQ
ncbi:MAG: hypothetical protein LBT74_11855 [Acidobacteriota bacterium]|jgi:hypothetical protein|nr:hypothetical protein [Acidobacteriota bacterium]